MNIKNNTKKSLQDHGLAPKKRFGQNFLVHSHTAEAIAASARLNPDDIAVEVGVGLGALTHPLASRVQYVYGFEVDHGIFRLHQEQKDLPTNVTLIHQDILKADFKKLAENCGGKLNIVANLPYSITNPFLFKLFDNASVVSSVTVMVQKEVAERLMAKPNTKAYGVPTILLGSCATISPLLLLKPAEFHPRPKVDSMVIRLDFSQIDRVVSAEINRELFQRIVRTAFNQRRKTLLNSLCVPHLLHPACEPKKSKEVTKEVIVKAGLLPSARPENLTIDDFLALTRVIEQERAPADS